MLLSGEGAAAVNEGVEAQCAQETRITDAETQV